MSSLLTLGLAEPTKTSTASRGITSAASMSEKRENEDAYATYQGERYNILVVADGVGSAVDAHLASARAASAMVGAARAYDETKLAPPRIVRAMWRAAATDLTAYRYSHPVYEGVAGALQTTMTALLETDDAYLLSYVGNGSAYVVRGDYWRFFEQGRWPWPITDVLLGHTVSRDGQEVLYDSLHPGRDTNPPGLWSIPKDRERGELLILTTDGVSSRDHARHVQDAQGAVYEECNPHVRSLLRNHLVHSLSADPEDRADVLAAELGAFLERAVVDDDATVGVIVSPAAYEYFGAKTR